MADEPLLIQYTNLLHQYRDPNAPELKAFVKLHRDDETFVRRAEMLNQLSKLKQPPEKR